MDDPIFPSLHIRPPRGWINDPNGICLIDGTYHVFFQHNPEAPTHGNVHWGHASSTDLLHWRYHRAALVPRPGMIDSAGCWSGCITDDNGVPTAVYTANPDDPRQAVVGLARSDRSLVAWKQDEVPAVATRVRPGVDEVRDPFLFIHRGHRYAVQGAGHRDGRPLLLLWECDDITRWMEMGTLLTDDDPIAADVAPANIWECPNLVRIEDQWVLVLSLWRWLNSTHRLIGVRYLLGDLVRHADGLRFKATSGGVLDDGPAFYAPHLLAGENRTLVWGWAWEIGRTPDQILRAGWAGTLTFPRELFLSDRRLGLRPAAELVGLRSVELAWQRPFTEHAFEVVGYGPVALRLVDGDQEWTATATGSPTSPARIFVDGSIVEIFQDGSAHTTRTYPSRTSHWSVVAPGRDVELYRLAVD